jgi:O-antigen/teichoic acid export membrane protein
MSLLKRLFLAPEIAVASAQTANYFLGFVLIISISRRLGLEEFGLLIFYQSCVNAITAVFGNPMMLLRSALGGRYLAGRYNEEFNFYYSRASIVFLTIAGLVALSLSRVADVSAIILVACLIGVLDFVYQGKYLVERSFRKLLFLSTLKLGAQAGAILFLYARASPLDADSAIYLYAVVQLFPTVINSVFDLKPISLALSRGAPRDSEVRVNFKKFLIPAVIGAALSVPVLWLGNAIILSQKDGAIILGALGIGFQLRNVLTFLSGKISYFILPRLGRDDSKSETVAAVTNYNRMIFAFGFSVTLILLLAVESIAKYMYGHSLPSDAIRGVKLLLIATLTGFSGAAFGALVQSRNLMWQGLVGNLLWAVGFLVTLAIVVGSSPYAAFGTAMIIGATFNLYWTAYFLKDEVPKIRQIFSVQLLGAATLFFLL